jgi:hypothetical protein
MTSKGFVAPFRVPVMHAGTNCRKHSQSSSSASRSLTQLCLELEAAMGRARGVWRSTGVNWAAAERTFAAGSRGPLD